MFNHDLNYFTPTFILSNEKVLLPLIQDSFSQNLTVERQKF